ncbi:MAG: o-succinylbenzoate--CoA ligase [Candidatus Margulisbacteria bacterium]|nr:o-succinylbenzoate--CoA ligase [Candidatus Margulisiibacteriota bacterium]
MLFCPIKKQAELHPNATAIRSGTDHISYAELHRLIDAHAITKDITTWCPTGTLEDIVKLWAIFRAEKIAFLLNTRLPQDQRQHYINLATNIVPSAATYLLTSGTTSAPKIAVHSFENYRINASSTLHNMPLIPGDAWLLNLPLFHVGGLGILFRCFLSGATVVLGHSFESVTHVSMVPTQLHRLLTEGTDFSRLHVVLLGGGPASKSLLKRAYDLGVPLYTTYGLTEMSSQVTTTSSDRSWEETQTGGHLLCDRELKIADNGEILVKGPTLFLGYLNSDHERDAWFHTKDRGFIDKLGRLHVLGRLDRMFISGGENIQPEEIECALLESDVTQAYVVSENDAEFGFRPVAFVDGIPNLEKLKSLLPNFKIPIRFLPWDNRPSSVTWKNAAKSL